MKDDEVILTDLEALIASDSETGGRPALPQGSRERVVDELERLVINRDDLAAHLQDLIVATNYTVRHRKPLPDELQEAVMIRGVGALDDGWLAKLALNPIALFGLHIATFTTEGDLPEVWWAVFNRLGREDVAAGRSPSSEEMLRRAGISVRR